MSIKSLRLIGSLSGVAIFTAAAACGGGSSGSGSSADSFASQYCDLYSPCCAKTGKTYDGSKCQALFILLSSGSTYDDASGQQCLAAARTASTDPTFCTGGSSDAVNTACKNVFKKAGATGAKKPGEACNDDSDCAAAPDGDVTCATSFTNNATTRACQVQTHGKEGDVCAGDKVVETNGSSSTTFSSGSTDGSPPPDHIALCYQAETLFCQSTFTGSKSTSACAKIQDVGGPCKGTSSAECVKTAFCDSKTSQCTAKKAAGAACDTFNSSECADKTHCDSTTKVCVASIPDGQACTKNEECETHECTNNKCGFGSDTGTTSLVCQ